MVSRKLIIATRSCPVCGGAMRRRTRGRTIRYEKRGLTIRQPAWWCRDCGEGILDSGDAKVADLAFATLKAEAEGVMTPVQVAAVRKRLGLSQRKAGEILGGGARAFQRYESGAVVVSRPMANLLRLLLRDPGRLQEIVDTAA
ncbi:MAG: type II toxin-antitoxin system MqsA family antitoxin [Pseudomonadota bacterium]